MLKISSLVHSCHRRNLPILLAGLFACANGPNECGIPEPPTPALEEIAGDRLSDLPGVELWVREIFRACQW